MSPSGPRPPHLSGPGIALVAVGGALGTGARYLLNAALPTWAGVPVAILGVNVLGAFLLGLLLERLAGAAVVGRSGVRLLRLRLLAGTGFLGGFTTYSALAADTVLLLAEHPGRAVGYALGTVLLGAGATVLGIRLASPGARGSR